MIPDALCSIRTLINAWTNWTNSCERGKCDILICVIYWMFYSILYQILFVFFRCKKLRVLKIFSKIYVYSRILLITDTVKRSLLDILLLSSIFQFCYYFFLFVCNFSYYFGKVHPYYINFFFCFFFILFFLILFKMKP